MKHIALITLALATAPPPLALAAGGVLLVPTGSLYPVRYMVDSLTDEVCFYVVRGGQRVEPPAACIAPDRRCPSTGCVATNPEHVNTATLLIRESADFEVTAVASRLVEGGQLVYSEASMPVGAVVAPGKVEIVQ